MRNLKSFVCVIAVLLGGGCGVEEEAFDQCPPESCPAPLPNSSFEEAREYPSNEPAGWFGSDPTVFIERVAQAADGAWGVEFHAPADSSYASPLVLQTSRGIRAAPGRTYKLGFSGDAPEASVSLTVLWTDDLNQCVRSASGDCASDTVVVSNTTGYQAVLRTVVAPVLPAPRVLYATLLFEATVRPGQRAWIDAVVFETW